MLLSVSRRTDIPQYYAPWFFGRLREGYVLVRNPRNPHQLSRVSLDPASVEGIVFWTKNPLPMLERLEELRGYPYYFQFTLTPYGRDVERALPPKGKVLVPAFQRLSRAIGPRRVLWRYDPIFFTDRYTPEYHLCYFERLAKLLAPYTERCTFSFLDEYPHTATKMAGLAPRPPLPAQRLGLAGKLARIAKQYGLQLCACAEEEDFSALGIAPARCVDPELLGQLMGCPLQAKKDPRQRPACGCAESVDIGEYDTCPGGCRYCYATRSARAAARHDPVSPLLTGWPGPEDRITLRPMPSCRQTQLRFGD